MPSWTANSAAQAAIRQRDEAQAWEAGKAREIPAANSRPHTISTMEALTPADAIKTDTKNSKADSAICGRTLSGKSRTACEVA